MVEANLMTGAAERRSLEEAIVDTVREPLIVLDDQLSVVAASRSFYHAFKVTRQDTEGRPLYELGDGQWNIPALRALLEDIIPRHTTIEAYEVEHDFPMIGRRTMLLNARKVFYEGNNSTSLLVAIEDVTERRTLEREKDELLRQKDFLLEEMTTGSTTACKSSRASCCLKHRRCSRKRRAGTWKPRMNGSCRSRRSRSNCTRRRSERRSR
jgi:hypothetical protein